jgi:S-formylglutathione hydrolase FrmB
MGIRGVVQTVLHRSRALEGNALGDPTEREVHVYLPPEYAVDDGRRFPVVYCLTGYTGTGAMLLNVDPWSPSLTQRLESLCARELAGPMILVMPDCFTRLGGSQYLNSSATGNYESYLVDEIVPWIDKKFRTIPEPSRRGLMGKSSGGYGSIIHAMRHPEIFGAVACHSGDMYFEYCYLPDFPKAARGLERRGGLIPFLKDFEAAPRKTTEMIEVLNIVAMAASYSPNPLSETMGIDLPFVESTGEIRDDVWQRWLAHDPVRLLPACADALRSASLVYLDCGTRDEFNLHVGARVFARLLRERNISHIHEEFEDGHMRITYRYERSLALLWQVLRERRPEAIR